MAQWIKRHVVNRVQDQWSSAIAKSQHNQVSLALVPVLRATNHDQEKLPDEAAVMEIIVGIGSQSRVRISRCVQMMMGRLSKTHSWVVALKCLILIHRCLCEGGFMFQDQISFHREICSGRNCLNMSNFKDKDSPLSWSASGWIRWYAGFVEKWIQTSRSLGLFFNCDVVREGRESDHIMTLPTANFVTEFMCLHEFLHEASMAMDSFVDHLLVKESLKLVMIVVGRAYEELQYRFKQIEPRISILTRSEAASLLQVCERLSSETMLLTHLFEVCSDVMESNVRFKEILITDYELLNLKSHLQSVL